MQKLPVAYRRQFELRIDKDSIRIDRINESYSRLGLRAGDRFPDEKATGKTIHLAAEEIAKLIETGGSITIERNGQRQVIDFEMQRKNVKPATIKMTIEF